jgi:hypothetical protein
MKTPVKFKILDIYMARGNGYGQYSIVVNWTAYGIIRHTSFHSTDSILWDAERKPKAKLLRIVGGKQALLDRI